MWLHCCPVGTPPRQTGPGMPELYAERRLTDGYPGIEQLAFEQYSTGQSAKADDTPRIERLLAALNRLASIDQSKAICVIGCGPIPQPIKILQSMGYTSVSGIEPVPLFVRRAAEYLNATGIVSTGMAEAIPLPSESQDIVMLENVIEHVDSPVASLAEIYRVLKPAGILYLSTNNRQKVSLKVNPEFRRRFYNFFPPLLKESYVFQHLHYTPHLANFTERPAVHWFSFAELCYLGRNAGFAKFYAPLDLRTPADGVDASSAVKRWMMTRRWLLHAIQQTPIIRSALLSQLPIEIFMVKRPA